MDLFIDSLDFGPILLPQPTRGGPPGPALFHPAGLPLRTGCLTFATHRSGRRLSAAIACVRTAFGPPSGLAPRHPAGFPFRSPRRPGRFGSPGGRIANSGSKRDAIVSGGIHPGTAAGYAPLLASILPVAPCLSTDAPPSALPGTADKPPAWISRGFLLNLIYVFDKKYK